MKDQSVIFKYEVLIGKTDINLPEHHKVLHVGVQNDKIQVWILHTTTIEATPKRVRGFHVVGTGWAIPDEDLENWSYKGTVHIRGFVWHIFAHWRPGD